MVRNAAEEEELHNAAAEDPKDFDESTAKPGGKKVKKGSGGFEAMGLSHPVFKAIIRKGYRVPTPIQRKVINLAIAGRDVVAMARTGSGKTAAFLIPLIERLQEHTLKVGARGVVLSPTRELAQQTLKFAQELGAFTNLRSCLLIGGESLEDQFASLAANPDILIATPGRLMHHLSQTDITLSEVQLCVFDEADRLFEMGFADQIREITNKMPEQKQTCLFSATLPQMLADFTAAGLREPELIRLDTDTKISEDLRVTFFTVRSEQKDGALLAVINEYIDDVEQTIIFAATRHHVEFLGGLLARAGYRTSIIFGDLDPAARRISVAKFRAKKSQFLVVTDIAARGIDIPMLDNVINYDFPMTSKLFVHRVGRAARAGRKGTAISFVSGDEMPYMLDVHLFLGRKPCNLPEAEVDINDPTTVVYGRFPSEMIEVQAAMVLDWVSRDPWLISQIKTMKNAYKAYFKSRSKASPQSVKRFKQLPPEAAIHPWIQQKLGSEAVLRIDMVSELKTFRPATQIFKMSSKSGTGRAGTVKVDPRVVAHRAARPTETVDRFDSDAAAAAQPGVGSTAAAPLKQGGVAPTGGKLSKRAKRKGAQHRQQALPQGQKPTATGRDEAFFIEHRPENAFVEDSLRVNNSDSGVHDNRTAIEEAVINLVNDDSALKKRSTMQWDKRKMKYIETNSTSTKGKRGIEIKNEAGVVISTKSRKTGKERPSFYQNWVEKTNTRIPKAGTMEASEALQGAERGANFVVGGKLVGKRRGKGGRLVGGDAGPGGGKGPRNAQEARNGMEKAARARGQGVKTGSTGKANGGVSELRLVAQIGKERKKKDMIKARLSKLKSKKKRRK